MKGYPYINKNGKKRSQSKEWSDIRAEMMHLKSQLNLTDDSFRPLSPYEDYQGIEEQIYQTFCKIENGKSRPVWLWQSLTQETCSIEIKNSLENYLLSLIQLNERIWFGATGTSKERSKIWFYEGKIEAIIKILDETCFFDEFYIVSKKYDWLICINHHDILIATGKDMPQKLKAIADIAKNKG